MIGGEDERNTMDDQRPVLTLAHSPDPDDVFMWWPITGKLDPREPSRVVEPPAIDTGRFRYRGLPADIDLLNRRAVATADLEITALSMSTYARVADRYTLTSCGASMGYGYGPKFVVRNESPLVPESFAGRLRGGEFRIAIPGAGTTAYLAFCLMVGGRVKHAEMPFDRITEAISHRAFEGGLLIHQAQLTFEQLGLRVVADVGDWWLRETGLPLPLGGNALRRDLDDRHGPGARREVAATLSRSIAYALDHRKESIEYALRFAPELDLAKADRYISMYVNDLTVDAGDRGLEAIRRLLREGARAGLCPDAGEIDLCRG